MKKKRKAITYSPFFAYSEKWK